MSAATVDGIEVRGDGRVYGLVRVHHWCGNDPVVEHYARVDLAHLVLYFEERRRALAEEPASAESHTRDESSEFSEFGWQVGDFMSFKDWSELAAEAGI